MTKVKEFGGTNSKPLHEQIKPMYDYLLITANKKVEQVTEGGIIIPKSVQQELYLPNQTVVAIGDGVDQVNIGDDIMLQVKHFLKPFKNTRADQNVEEGMKVDLPLEEINGVDYMLIQQRNIKYVILKSK